MSSERNAPAVTPAAQAKHDFQPPKALVEFMSRDWIDRSAEVRAHPQAARFAQRREALSEAYRGSYLVIPSGTERVRANDTSFRFRPSSDFAYLAGDGDPSGVLVLEPEGARHRSLLFVLEHNRGRAEFFTDRVAGELWVGRHRGVDESLVYYGVDECRPLRSLPVYLN
ncbi:MAG TPA: aminopeptidase P N-terminal domain-containing protein [Candidatus Cybelea sp.]